MDGCRAGWLVAVAVDGPPFEALQLRICRRFAEAIELTAPCGAVMVDMPIGLPADGERRACDLLARQLLGSRRHSVFLAPPRSVLRARTATEFQELHRRVMGCGAGYPVWNLVQKLREVDSVMTPALQERVLEFHPELAWLRLADVPLPSKHCQPGLERRRSILEAHVPRLGSFLNQPLAPRGGARVDDLLDAVAGLLVADAVLRGRAKRLPAEPPRDERGLRMEIWY